jgi:hypothetical protein
MRVWRGGQGRDEGKWVEGGEGGRR